MKESKVQSATRGRAEKPAESQRGRSSGGRKVIIQPQRADALERQTWVEIGRMFREVRLQKELTLEGVAELVKLQTHGYIITPSQISRIESGRRDPGFFNTKVIASALGISANELAGDRPAYFYYLFSPEQMQKLLKDHLDGKIKTSRHDGRHPGPIRDKVYRPIPLEPDKASRGNGAILENSMSINLLRVEPASLEYMMGDEALDSHDGEEVIYVIEGELEFFFIQRPHLDLSEAPDLRREIVSAGGCIHYSASGRHGFRAIGDGPALALYVASKPRAYVVEVPKKPEASDRRRQK
jgi:transcriptional regulator with XRE-family HTH domain